MHSEIIYFSGTGNTKHIATIMSQKLMDSQWTIRMESLVDDIHITPDSYDLLIIGFPKYFEYIPIFLLELFTQKIPLAKSTINTIVFCTEGGPMKTDIRDLSEILKAKNHKLIISKSITMPNNYFLENRYKPDSIEKCAQKVKKAETETEEIIQNFLRGNFRIEHMNPFWGGMFRNLAYKKTTNLSTKESKFSVSNACTGCSLCKSLCPKRNILISDNKATFSSKCVLCLRCINFCPQNAIIYDDNKLPQYKLYRELIVDRA